jgi:hypothetical protein
MAQNSDQTVIVTIGPDGSVQTEVKGVKGAACMDVTRQLEAALGTVKETQRTAEYSERGKEETSVRQVRARG